KRRQDSRLLGETGRIVLKQRRRQPRQAALKDAPQEYEQHDNAQRRRAQAQVRERLGESCPAAMVRRWFVEAHSYFSRMRLTNHWATMLSDIVTMNSARPTAKIVRYSIVPSGVSPWLICTM